MRFASWCLISVALSWLAPTHAWARRGLRLDPTRRLRRDTIKEVKVHRVPQTARYWLHWRSPGGKHIRYRILAFPQGLKARIKKLLKAGHKTIAVGGRYNLNTADTGVVRPAFAYAIKHKWRGVRVVKLDGLMPLYTATRLPSTEGRPAPSYTLYGTVYSSLNKRDNKLVCLYGTWFTLDVAHRPHRVSQSRGVKGRSLFFFAEKYRTPRTWRQLPDAAARRKAYFAAKQRKAKGLPPLVKKRLIPLLSKDKRDAYLATCRKRLAPWERKFSSPSPKPKSR